MPEARRLAAGVSDPQQCLYLRPLPQGHGSFLPILAIYVLLVRCGIILPPTQPPEKPPAGIRVNSGGATADPNAGYLV